MKLTRAGEYAVRCVLYLAARNCDHVTSRREIAEAMDIPHQFLGKIAQELSRAGILRIIQGAQGGYRLLRPPHEISLLSVVEAVEGEISLNVCLTGMQVCERAAGCPVHPVWGRANEGLRDALRTVNFDDLARHGECPGASGTERDEEATVRTELVSHINKGDC